MFRISLLAVACVALLRQSSCLANDDGPCEYANTPLEADHLTPWGSTVAEDVAALEVAQQGTWRWYPSTDELDIENGGTELAAQVSFVADPSSYRLREHVAGGHGVACYGPTVMVDGTLTFTNEQNDVIVSIPLTAERTLGNVGQYSASPVISPVPIFSAGLTEKVEYEVSGIGGTIHWRDNEGFIALFDYLAQTTLTDESGLGVVSPVAEFE